MEAGSKLHETCDSAGSIPESTSWTEISSCLTGYRCILLISSCTFAFLLLIKLGIIAFRRYFTVTHQVIGGFGSSGSADDLIYHNLVKWLGKNIKTFHAKKITTVSMYKKLEEEQPASTEIVENKSTDKSTSGDSDDSDDDDDECRYRQPSSDEVTKYRSRYSLGYGTHYFLLKGAFIQVERRFVNPKIMVNGFPQEILEFTTACWNEEVLKELLDNAKPKVKIPERGKIQIYRGINGSHWGNLGGPKRRRPLKTIILDKNVIDKLLKDIETFLELEDWYVDRGIPYRRAYLLYGPPGNGKSSVIKSIAGEIGYDISILSLSQGVTDDSITDMLNNAPKNSIILLEDIDAAFKSREDPSATSRETNLAFEGCSKSALTFRGLLNALDGVGSAEDGTLIFMTTNYPERLDPALVRPGRVDYKVLIDYPTNIQLEKMFDRFYPEGGIDIREKFVKRVRELTDIKVSMAMVQGLFLVYKDDPEGALDNVKEFLENHVSSSTGATFRGLYN